jgi:hypothetical protein
MNYKKVYDQICSRAKNLNRVKGKKEYFESHHIIPLCLGGTGSTKEWQSHENIVLLTAREHFLCHWLLHEMYPDNIKLTRAFNLMCRIENPKQSRYKPSSRIIQYAKEIDRKSRLGSSGFWKGKKLSEETKEKIRLANLGKKQTKETIKKRHESKINGGGYKKQADSIRGRKWSDEQRTKIKLWNNTIGYKHSEETRKKMRGPRKKIECPHCLKEGNFSAMKRWHFDNCKLLKK